MSSEKAATNKHLFHRHIDEAAQNLLCAIRFGASVTAHTALGVSNGVNIRTTGKRDKKSTP